MKRSSHPHRDQDFVEMASYGFNVVRAPGMPAFGGTGIAAVRSVTVAGGFVFSAAVCGNFDVTVAASGASVPTAPAHC